MLDALEFDGEQYFFQVGHDNLYIGTARDIHYERIYQGNDPQIIEELKQIVKILIKKFSTTLSSDELLRIFETTENCHYLLKNPDQIGYQSTFKLLIVSLLIIIGSILIFKTYIGDCWIEANSLWEWCRKIMCFLLSSCSSFLFVLGSYQLISNIKSILHKKWRIRDSSVFAIPVRIVKLYPENNIPSKVLLEQSNKKRYWVTPNPDYPNWTLCKDDVGVVYLRPKCEYDETLKVIRKGYLMLDFIHSG